MNEAKRQLQEIRRAMKSLKEMGNYDIENSHLEADCLIMEFLELIGEKEFCKDYDDVKKWYA